MNSNYIKRLNKTKSAKLYVHRKFCFALQVPFDTMLLLLCLWEGEFYQKGQTLGPARVGRHDKVWACNVLYQTWQPLWPSGQTSGFFPHPTLLYRTNTSLHYARHHLNLTGETISTQPHSSWWCVCVCCIIDVLCWSGTKTGLSKWELFYNLDQGKCGVRQQGKVRSVGVALCIIHLLRIVSD